MEEDSGILRRVPGQHIATAMSQLLDAATASAPTMDIVAEVPAIGVVCFTFARFYHRHGKSSRWFWTIERARLEPAE